MNFSLFSSWLAGSIRGLVATVVIIAACMLLIPSKASAIYVAVPQPPRYNDVTFDKLPGFDCIGYNRVGVLGSICTRSDIERIWYRDEKTLCFVDGPFFDSDRLPIKFTAKRAFGPKNHLLRNVAFIDQQGNKQSRHYSKVSGKAKLCTRASAENKAGTQDKQEARQAKVTAPNSETSVLAVLLTIGLLAALALLAFFTTRRS